MSFSSTNNLAGFPQPLSRAFPAPVLAQRAPTTSDLGYQIGQTWINEAGDTAYILVDITAGSATWAPTGGGSTALSQLTGDTGTATPTAGSIEISGTASQITTSASGSTVTAAFATPNFTLTNQIALMSGAVTGGITVEAFNTSNTAGDVATVGAVATDNNAYFVAADDQANLVWSFGNSNDLSHNFIFATDVDLSVVQATLTRTGALTTAGAITATTGGLIASAGGCSITGTANINTSGAAATNIGNGGTGAVNIGNGTGNTAVTGNLTVTGGSVSVASAGAGLILNPTVASGAAGGTVNCNGRVGSITFTGVSVAQNADITLTMGNTSIAGASTRCIFSMSGATTNSALTVKSYTPSANQVVWVVTNGGTATSTANITFDFIVIN